MLNENRGQLVHEAVRLAELNLTSELSMLIAADQRASTFSGMIVAALAVVAVIYDQDTSNWTDDLSLLILGFSAGLSVYSLRSVKITVPGNKFENLASDIEKRRDFNTVLAELGRHYDEASAKNRATLRRNAVFFNAALVWSTVGFGVSLIPNMFSLVPPFINFIVKFWESVQ